MSHGVGISPKDSKNHKTTTPKTFNTAGANLHMHGKPSVAKVKSEVRKAWTKTMEAEERSKLLRILIREGIGTNEVESYLGKQAERKFGGDKGKRNGEAGR